MGTGHDAPGGRQPIRIRDRTLRSLKSIDDMLGAVRNRLEETGEENTIIVFTSDNGMQWGDHGLAGKTTPYIPSVRVLLYVSWPGHIAPGRRSNLVALLDLPTTLLDLAGVPTSKVLDGRSLFGNPRSQLLLEFYSWPGFSVPTWKAFVTPTLEYIEYYRLDGTYLTHEAYDMVDDRRQLRNSTGTESRGTSHRPDHTGACADSQPVRGLSVGSSGADQEALCTRAQPNPHRSPSG